MDMHGNFYNFSLYSKNIEWLMNKHKFADTLNIWTSVVQV
jgi:hypothetical protein